MKIFKLFLISLLSLFLISCNNDNESSFIKEESQVEVSYCDDYESMGNNQEKESSKSLGPERGAGFILEKLIPEEELTTTIETTQTSITMTTPQSAAAPQVRVTTTNATAAESKKETTTTEEIVETTTTTAVIKEKEIKILYKPSTHYFHNSNCRWVDDTCIENWDLAVVEGRLCSECKPKLTLINYYKEEEKKSNLPITQSEFIMLANLVAHEYGAYWVPTAEKAKVVMTVMDRVRDKRYPNNVRDVILQKNQYCWVPNSYYWKRTTQDCKDAVTYYFNHQDQYSKNLFSFWGNGYQNFFY